jgi:hypothetical protein
MCEIVHLHESTKWKTLKTKCRKKASPLKTTEAENVSHVAVVNRYELLLNLQDSQDDSVQPRTQGKVRLPETHDDLHLQNLREKDATSGTHDQDKNSIMQVDNRIHPQLPRKERTQQRGKNVKISNKDCQVHHIPTILNGKTEVKNTGVTKNEVNYKNGKNNTHDCKQHKVIMIGDSFIRGITDNVEMSISDRFGIYSLLHPGGNLDTILHSAYKASENLTKKDLIYVCGGTNDFISDTEGPNVDSILEFMQSNKHTNVIFANVPLRYDLSYYSQINENIRTYNRKIRETTQEHEQVALMELNTERKNHTRHGLHFNKLGKWWLTYKIKKINIRISRRED